MNLAQGVTISVALLLMGFITFQDIFDVVYEITIYKYNYVHYLLLIAFVGGGLFVLFGIKRKKKTKE
ncbi:MAG: hypothetical protein OEY18_15435 [Candidatus Aminicenantes bacterium]|nr:hypothetical protein [Candidatus Aminicenantes bacterium]MDH5386091.1 hypothetical protein [Candidatus Aminicenantes bacterium]MDH5744383.1 hypothetical protein [Candidatus Aminicenantes bacterium]